MCSECSVSNSAFHFQLKPRSRFEIQTGSGMFKQWTCTCEECHDLVKVEQLDYQGQRQNDKYCCRYCHHEVKLG
jgi:hypothetical protein